MRVKARMISIHRRLLNLKFYSILLALRRRYNSIVLQQVFLMISNKFALLASIIHPVPRFNNASTISQQTKSPNISKISKDLFNLFHLCQLRPYIITQALRVMKVMQE